MEFLQLLSVSSTIRTEQQTSHLICYADGEKAYILAPEGLADGMKVMNGPEAEVTCW